MSKIEHLKGEIGIGIRMSDMEEGWVKDKEPGGGGGGGGGGGEGELRTWMGGGLITIIIIKALE